MIFLGKSYFIPILAFWNSFLLIRKKIIVESRVNFTKVAIICSDQEKVRFYNGFHIELIVAYLLHKHMISDTNFFILDKKFQI